MTKKVSLVVMAIALVALPTMAQKTPEKVVAAYDALANIILDMREAEHDFVVAVLDGHMHGAKMLFKKGDYEGAAAEMALVANEGDNAVGGVRKRLLEGGHHFNAEGEEQGIFEPGYVVVNREAKKKMLAASSALRQAKDDVARKAAWDDFAGVAKPLLAGE
ncbi:MAG: hypothetical protein EP299_13005 [Acidobacteria bacterium]|nr:MAG: hypothetical protein EP299_13005 [Acidobacteriota bacterium]